MVRRTDRRRDRKAEAARQAKRRRQACRSQTKATGPRPMRFDAPSFAGDLIRPAAAGRRRR
jgi:hypothetical protein